VLVAILSPPFSCGFDGMADAEVLEELLQVLGCMFGVARAALPELLDAKVTRWELDPYARGSYSFMKTGASFEHILEMQAPEHYGRLLFAGEACAVEDAQCVTGAYTTGLNAAQHVVALMEKSGVLTAQAPELVAVAAPAPAPVVPPAPMSINPSANAPSPPPPHLVPPAPPHVVPPKALSPPHTTLLAKNAAKPVAN